MKEHRNGKIIATVGTSLYENGKIDKLLLNGIDVFRLNFSHGTHKEHALIYAYIREVAKKYGRHPAVIADLQGPKLRVGRFEGNEVTLKREDTFVLDLDSSPGNEKRVNFPHPEIFESLQRGMIILLDDGKIQVEVKKCEKGIAETKVLVGGRLSNKKGINIPDVMIKTPILSEKDLKDLGFALNLGVDWIALSFVQSMDDVQIAKKIIDGRAGIIAKLENLVAIKNLEPIVNESDAIMIGRGDLGVEVPFEDVPIIQNRVINACRRMGKPVIIATHMLESMTFSPNATRAEVSDVANAVYSGVDATMLSVETASGKYPLEAANVMQKIIKRTEKDPYFVRVLEKDSQLPKYSMIDSLCVAAKEAAEYSSASVVVFFSESFNSIMRYSRLRSKIPVVLITDSVTLANKSSLCYGIHPIVTKKEFELSEMIKTAKRIVIERKFSNIGDNIVVVNDVFGTALEICKV